MNRQLHTRLKPLGWSLLSVAVVAIIAKLLSLILTITPNILFAGAIALATIYGGLKGGIISLLTTVLTINYFFIAPLHALTLATDDLFRGAVLSTSVLVAYLFRQKAQVDKGDQEPHKVRVPPTRFKP